MSTEDGRLDRLTHEKIFREEILTESQFIEATEQTRPKAILLGGQPGAGKGGMSDAAKLELGNDAVVIDPDRMREYDPRLKRFRNTNPYTWSGDTQSQAAAFTDDYRNAVVAGRKNLIFDTAWSQLSRLLNGRPMETPGWKINAEVDGIQCALFIRCCL